ncbi:MAG: chemotaxis protein CheW [Bacteroidetes bacterium]|nr:chemotaxis protein CheW [Bacteroidota bacterium]
MKELPKINSCWNSIGVWGDNTCPELKKYNHCRNCTLFINSGKELFEKEIPEGYLNEWTEILSREKIEDEKADNSCLIFRLGTEWFGIDSNIVVEVTDFSAVHSLPHQRSKLLQGIVNVRGEIKLAVELYDLLGVEKQVDVSENKTKIFKRHIVIQKNKDSWVIPVDEVFGVVKFNEKRVTSLPATAKTAKENFLRGFIKTDKIEAGIIVSGILFESLGKNVF